MTPNDPNPVQVRTRSLLERVGSPYAALRTAREEAGISLSDLSDRLDVRPAFLEAVEAGNLAVLPGSSYAGSLINMYATHLGLDGETLVEAAFPVPPPATVPQAPDTEPPAPGPSRIIPGPRLMARRPSFTPGAPPQAPGGRGAVGTRGVAPDMAGLAPAPVSAAASGVALPDSFAPPTVLPTVSTGAEASPVPPRAPVATVDAPYPGDPVPAEDRRGGRTAEVPEKPMQWVPAPSTLAVAEPASDTAVPAGPAVKALQWAALVLFVAAVLAALVLIAIVLVRSFEPQTPLGVLLPWLGSVRVWSG